MVVAPSCKLHGIFEVWNSKEWSFVHLLMKAQNILKNQPVVSCKLTYLALWA